MTKYLPLLFGAGLSAFGLYSSDALACAADRPHFGSLSKQLHGFQYTFTSLEDGILHEATYGSSYRMNHHFAVLPSIGTRNVHGEFERYDSGQYFVEKRKPTGLTTVNSLAQLSTDFDLGEGIELYAHGWAGPAIHFGHYYFVRNYSGFDDLLENSNSDQSSAQVHTTQGRLQQGGMLQFHFGEKHEGGGHDLDEEHESEKVIMAGFDSSVKVAGNEVGELGNAATVSMFGGFTSPLTERFGINFGGQVEWFALPNNLQFHDSRVQVRGLLYLEHVDLALGIGGRRHQELSLEEGKEGGLYLSAQVVLK